MEPGDDVRRRPRRDAGDGDERLITRLVVDADWLESHLDEVVVCDVRWSLDDGARRSAYEAGHIPGAVFVDLDRDLSGKPAPGVGRHPLPDSHLFAASMSRLGIGDDDRVVAYDDAGGAVAARLVWMLRILGEEAALLDGGLDAWSGATEGGSVAVEPARFTPRAWPADRIADADLVEQLRTDPAALIIDARDAERYRGETEPVDPEAGHIPGARNAPWRDNLGADGLLVPADRLRGRYEELGAGDRMTVVHCGSGVTACQAALAIEAAGLPPPRVYVGSWSGWCTSDRPVAVGETP